MSSSNLKVYDLEIFPNYFLAGFKDVNSGKEDFFTIYQSDGMEINDLYALLDYIQDKWLVGFNSRDYDNQIIHHLLKQNDDYLSSPPKVITNDLYKLSVKIIEEGFNKLKWDLPFNAIDLKRVGNIDKSLKMCGVDLKWYNILDLIRPHDIPVEDNELGDILDYNINDLGITNRLYEELRDDIIMRQELSVKYKTDIMDYADSGVADRLLEKFYAERTNQNYWSFKNANTERSWILLDECISDKIMFSTHKMKSLLQKIKGEALSVDSKFQERILIGDTHYDMLKGGLHSVRQPEIFESTEDMDIIEIDVSSYYPNFMINSGTKPAHLQPEFLDILKDITHTRIKAKKAEDWVTSDGLKITINSVFGKMGYKYSWMYDLKAMYSVTINCQLFLLMLIEMLEEDNFSVIYGNTDGLFVKVPKTRRDKFDYICKRWQEYTNFELDHELYKKCVIRDVNNYLVEKQDGDMKMKGAFDTERWKDLGKGYKYPVVPLAVKQYFVEGIPVEETIQNHKDILDFCIAQKAGKKFNIVYYWNESGQIMSRQVQQTNRYFIGKGGGSLMKETSKKQISMVAGEPVVLLNEYDKEQPIEVYNIKHQYYIKEAYKIVNEFQSKQQNLFS